MSCLPASKSFHKLVTSTYPIKCPLHPNKIPSVRAASATLLTMPHSFLLQMHSPPNLTPPSRCSSMSSYSEEPLSIGTPALLIFLCLQYNYAQFLCVSYIIHSFLCRAWLPNETTYSLGARIMSKYFRDLHMASHIQGDLTNLTDPTSELDP